MPWIDPETGQGLVTDVALKRKVRNYVGIKHGNQPPTRSMCAKAPSSRSSAGRPTKG
jgi:CRISPR-associated protein Csd2